jgi:hypothetical protein
MKNKQLPKDNNDIMRLSAQNEVEVRLSYPMRDLNPIE